MCKLFDQKIFVILPENYLLILTYDLTSALAPSGNIYDISGPVLSVYLELSVSGVVLGTSLGSSSLH